jgi:hypothetical protein
MPFVIPSLIKLSLGAIGAAAIVHWVVKEVHRMNAELERIKVRATEPFRREALPTLRRDPLSGEWRISDR